MLLTCHEERYFHRVKTTPRTSRFMFFIDTTFSQRWPSVDVSNVERWIRGQRSRAVPQRYRHREIERGIALQRVNPNFAEMLASWLYQF